MAKKKTKADLDDATIKVVKQVLAVPPKRHEEIKVDKPKKKQKRGRYYGQVGLL